MPICRQVFSRQYDMMMAGADYQLTSLQEVVKAPVPRQQAAHVLIGHAGHSLQSIHQPNVLIGP